MSLKIEGIDWKTIVLQTEEEAQLQMKAAMKKETIRNKRNNHSVLEQEQLEQNSTTQELETKSEKNKVPSKVIGLRKLHELCTLCKFSREIQERAVDFYHRYGKISSVNAANGLAVASVFTACQEQRVIISAAEIAKLSDVPKQKIVLFYHRIIEKIDVKLIKNTPADFIKKACETLVLPDSVRTLAEQAAAGVAALKITDGKSPVSIAAACIHSACQNSAPEFYRSKRKISLSLGTSETTTLKTSRKMIDELSKIISRNFLQSMLPTAAPVFPFFPQF